MGEDLKWWCGGDVGRLTGRWERIVRLGAAWKSMEGTEDAERIRVLALTCTGISAYFWR